MGWTSYHRPAGESDRDHLQRELCGSTYAIVDSTTIRNTFYAAVRTIATGEVWCLVVLQQRGRGDHNYARKEIEESMGPYECDCPDRILDLLTPTDNAHANEWRAKCRERNATKRTSPKVKRGDTVRFTHPMAFGNGHTGDTFTFVERSTFSADGTLYRITSWRDRAHTVESVG